MDFDMAIGDNFASFFDEQTGLHVFVGSFDNQHFAVRIGSAEESTLVGSVKAASDEELNAKLKKCYVLHIGSAWQ